LLYNYENLTDLIAVSSNTAEPKRSDSLSRKRQKPTSPTAEYLQDIARIAGGTLLGMTMLASSVIAGGLVGLAVSFRNLPDVRVLRNYVPAETSYVYDINGSLLASMHDEANREVVDLNEISPNMKRAVLAIEDSYFYTHHGINPGGVLRASLANFREGRTVEGGSTVTMQLVKNLFLSPERSFNRKIAEAVLALRLEQVFTKDQILEMYLNQVYWGHNNYGVETAARSYFNKSAGELTLGESAMMAGLIQAPENYSPFISMETAKKRQATVLDRMVKLKWITAEEAATARKQEIKLGKITAFSSSQSPYVTDAVVTELNDRFGKDAVLKGGMRIQTSIDMPLQKIAEDSARRGLQNAQYKGAYADQIALVAVDPRTHFVKAMVGGFDYKQSQYNRATQAMRQPGSAFKPFVYYTAFASGKWSPDAIISDSPVSYRDGDGWYSPRNYDGSFAGPMTVRSALAMSRNIPAIRLGQDVGINRVIEVCRTLGIKSPIEPVVSLPLGSVDLTPMEMAGAYATFASGGWQSPTTTIVQITDGKGDILLDNTPKPQLVLDPWAAASLNDTLQTVINSGTATAAQIGRPAAGKTGTTSSERDIWFVGYVPQLATAVWIGNDDYSQLGAGSTGGTMVAPVWRDFMSQAVKDMPVEQFKPAANFVRP
jgi:penicillin-binding protein 1A